METSTATSAFPILKLPVEVRLYIYRELLIQPSSFEPMLCSCYAERHQYWKDRGSIHPAILRTCKLAYAEAYPILYRDNIFQLSCNYHGHAAHECNLPNARFIAPHEKGAALLHRAVIDLDLESMSSNRVYLSVVERVKGDYPSIRQLVVRTANHATLPDYSYLEVTLQWVQLTTGTLRRYLLTLEDLLLRMRTTVAICNENSDKPGSVRIVQALHTSSGFWMSIIYSLSDDLGSLGGDFGSHGDYEGIPVQAVLFLKEWSQEEGLLWCIRDSGLVDYHPNLQGR